MVLVSKKNENDKYIIRSPKIGVLINDLIKREIKLWSEKLMPMEQKYFKSDNIFF